MTLSFFAKLEARVKEIDSLLCVGLDPHSKEIVEDPSATTPQEKCDAAYTFCKTLIDATLPYAACYKPNAAFFEALGDQGTYTLHRVLKEIPSNVPILLDVKRGDIGSTATAYAEACYDHLNADAVTLSPLMGWDSVAPFVTGESAKPQTGPLFFSANSAYLVVAALALFLDVLCLALCWTLKARICTKVHFCCARPLILVQMTCWH